MKLLRVVLTAIFAVITFLIIMTMSHLVIMTVTGPLDGSKEGYNRPVITVSKELDEGGLRVDERVALGDFVGFGFENIEHTVDKNPYYYVRRTPWISNFEWFQKVGKYIDHGIHFVVEGFKTTLIPSLQVNNMNKYYNRNFDEININGYFFVRNGHLNYTATHRLDENGDKIEIIITDENVRYDLTTDPLFKVNSNVGSLSVYDVQNEYLKWERFNGGKYNLYHDIFYVEQDIIKPATILLYVEVLITLLVTIYVVYQLPIKVNRDGMGEAEVTGTFLPRITRRGRKKDKKKRRKNKDR